jgi:predicted DNA binding protein
MSRYPRELRSGRDSPIVEQAPLPVPPRAARGDFAVYRIAVQLPKNSLGYAVTHGHPELRAEVLNRMEMDDDLVLLEARVFGPGAGELSTIMRALPYLVRYDVHRENDLSAVYRIILKRPPLVNVLRRHRVLTRYPLVYVDGWVRFETLAPASQVRQFVVDLRREVGPSRVEAVRQGSVTPSALGLTDSQLVIFRAALAAGYFASPRRTSVTKLAQELRRSKSNISEQLALIQRRLAESALRLKWDPATFPG